MFAKKTYLRCYITYTRLEVHTAPRLFLSIRLVTVRISKVRGPFAKGYEKNYTEEFFTVKTCIPRDPPVYRLCDYDGDVVDGVFYEAELQKISVSKNKTFKIEKILDRRREGRSTKVLVQWVGWPSKFNTWLNEKDVVDVQTP